MTVEIKDIPFFKNLTALEMSELKKCLVERSFKKSQILHGEGSECSEIFFVKSGRVKIHRLSHTGKEQIYEVLGPGDTCACNPGETSWKCGLNAEALSDCTVWFLSRGIYLRLLADSPVLMHSLNELFAKRLQCFGNIIEDVTLKDSKKRVIKFLLDMLQHKHSLVPQSDTLFIEATREEIAHRLGMARETVARQISNLKRQKLIDVRPYQIIIIDEEKLKSML